MKKVFSLLVGLALAPVSFAADAANDVIITQRNSANDDFVQRNVTATANGVLVFNGSLVPVSATTLAGLTLTTPNIGAATGTSITGPSLTDLTLTGGSSGASLVLGQGATKPATLTVGSGLLTITGGNVSLGGGAKQRLTLPIDTYVAFEGSVNAPYVGIGFDSTFDGLLFRTNIGAADINTTAAGIKRATGNLLIGGTTDIAGSGGLKVFGTTASTSTTSGALQVAGGAGIAGATYIGGLANVAGNLTVSGTSTLGSSGSAISTIKTATATLDFGSTIAGAVSDLTIALTGATTGDTVALGLPNGSVTATATFSTWCSANDTITVRYSPKATEDPASGTFRVTLIDF